MLPFPFLPMWQSAYAFTVDITRKTIVVYLVSVATLFQHARLPCHAALANPLPPCYKPLTMAGYSRTPLAQKLGIKPGSSVVVMNEPPGYRNLLGDAAKTVSFSKRAANGAQFVHFFTKRRDELHEELRELRGQIAHHAAVWISWPKKSAGIATDVTEDVIRAVALPMDFVDVKVCAVDEVWSGLKLMIRKECRRSR
jgi:hypothetical protein